MQGQAPFRIAVASLGCKVNRADIHALEAVLADAPLRFVAADEPADLLLLNTCTVTAAAERDARHLVLQAERRNPPLPVVVTGCHAQTAPAEVATWPGVVAVVGVAERDTLPALLRALARGERPLATEPAAPDFRFFPEPERFRPLPPRARTRPLLKIQDGCDRRCSYCAVPLARGPSRSAPPDRVLHWLALHGAQGAQEVVLAGVHLGRYGRDLDPATSLAALLTAIEHERPVPRVRLSSLEPEECDDELLAVLAASRAICPHLHIPLQSGSPDVLRRMGRPADPATFERLVLRVRGFWPAAAIGVDLIVGFPGESDADFEATRALLERTDWTYLHVFPFSARPNTPAAAAPDPVPDAVRRGRAAALRALSASRREAFARRLLGSTRELLVEAPQAGAPGFLRALSDNYQRVRLVAPDVPTGALVAARLVRYDEGQLVAHGASATMPAAPTDETIAFRESCLRLPHAFRRPELAEEALTHRSYRNEHPELRADNERLEFLGDSVLGMIVSETLMERFPDRPEGWLTRMRGQLVSEAPLAEVARALGLGELLRLGHGERMSGGAEKASILSSAFEAVVAAVYLDGGYPAARDFVRRCIDTRLQLLVHAPPRLDFKSLLQEWMQRRRRPAPEYEVIDERGPQHSKTFRVAVRVDNEVAAEGEGLSKKEAEQAAAARALRALGITNLFSQG